MDGRFAYIAYQIWLSRNSLVFEIEVISIHRVLSRAVFMATEYYYCDVVDLSLEALEF